MFLLTAPIVKNSHILAGIYFVFLKNVVFPNEYKSIYDLTQAHCPFTRWLNNNLQA